jgi:YbgC/YbaW family acyl-CoA thioester hydrolase
MFSTKARVYFFDADPAGIIFYASLFKFVHTAYEDFMKSLHTERNYFFDDNIVLPIVHAESDYKKPIKVGDNLKINVTVSQVRESSFELSYIFYNESDALVAAAKTVHAAVDKASFKKTALPADLRKKLTSNPA